MIKIRREGCPTSLNKSGQFTEADCSKPDVTDALLRMQHGKCCYCERDLAELAKPEREVEHYTPKSNFKDKAGNIQWHLANKWGNLLCSCRSCNSNKGTQLPLNPESGQLEIIDPSSDGTDPEEHIGFLVDDLLIVFVEKNGSKLGRSTIDKLGLFKRHDLYAHFRKTRLQIDQALIELVNAAMDKKTDTVKSKISELSRATSAHLPFAAFRRSFIERRIQEINDSIPAFEAHYGKTFDKLQVSILKGYETLT